MNDILIPHLKAAFGLTDFQSSFVQVAFFGGYFLAALPAGWLMERVGYKKGILTGLFLTALGALLFLPASVMALYGFFLIALFTIGFGQSFLEVAANPYATILGPAGSSERRLNFAQSFNAVGSVLWPTVGRRLILTAAEYTPAQVAVLSAGQLEAYHAAQAATTRIPYAGFAVLLLLVAGMIYWTHLPDLVEHEENLETTGSGGKTGGIFSHGHLWKGVLAQFFYVGAQVGVASFIIRFAQHTVPGMTAKVAGYYLIGHQIGFMVGRFTGSAMMKRVSAPKLLSIFVVASIVLVSIAIAASGIVPVWAVVSMGFFHSIMFPTIFALSIKNLGPHTKRGSSLLVLSISGAFVIPAIMGKISDLSNMQRAFLVPLICYVYVLYFALAGYKPASVSGPEQSLTS